jgi:hypothetical protein
MLNGNLYFFDKFFRRVPFWILPNLLICTPLFCVLVKIVWHYLYSPHTRYRRAQEHLCFYPYYVIWHAHLHKNKGFTLAQILLLFNDRDIFNLVLFLL